jgi:hypothetical protein
MLPDGVSLFQNDERDEDGYYQLLPDHRHVFEFTVPAGGLAGIQMIHHLTTAQDSTLVVWFSTDPLDGVLFRGQCDLENFRMSRAQRTIVFYDAWTNELEDVLTLPSERTYYLNVANLQNRINGYKLTISDA